MADFAPGTQLMMRTYWSTVYRWAKFSWKWCSI